MSNSGVESVRTAGLDAAEALEAARAAAWRWEIGSPVIEWSSDAARLLGLPEVVLRSPELLVGAVHPGDVPLVSRSAADSWETGVAVSSCFRLRLAGRVRWFDVSGRVVRQDREHPDYATGTAREVTETREAADAILSALREAESSLAQLGAGVGEWDSETNVVKVFSGLPGLGLAAQSPHQVPLDAVLRDMDDLGRARLRAGLSRAVADQESFTVEVKMKDDDGEVRRVMVKGGAAPTAGRVRLVALVVA